MTSFVFILIHNIRPTPNYKCGFRFPIHFICLVVAQMPNSKGYGDSKTVSRIVTSTRNEVFYSKIQYSAFDQAQTSDPGIYCLQFREGGPFRFRLGKLAWKTT